MSKRKDQTYYSLDSIKKLSPTYAILYGERSNGKSYAVKNEILTNAYEKKEKFVYLRRWQVDIKSSSVEGYFADMPISKITKGQSDTISVYRTDIYFAKTNEDGTLTRHEKIGKAMYLGGAEHYKSLAMVNYTSIVFEEFITDMVYLPNEVNLLMSVVSTVARRKKIMVYLIGNTVSPLSPYFREWELVNVTKQKQGTIDIYEKITDQKDENGNPVIITIGVEYCENSGNNSKMFFGKSSQMITGGKWESHTQPHLPYDYKECTVLYSLIIIHESVKMKMELLKRGNEVFVFAYPYTAKKPVKRMVVDYVDPSPYVTQKLYTNIKGEKIMGMLIKAKKVFFSDDLTGTLFYQIEKQKGGYI